MIDENTTIRFWYYVKKSDNCWEWTGGQNGHNYGVFTVRRKPVGAHRFSWTLHYGPIPEDMNILHKCNNTLCVRPDHLYPGTQADNAFDRSTQGRDGRQKLTTDEVIEIRNLYGSRNYTQKRLGKMFGVSRGTISYVVNYKTFCYID